MLCRFAKTAGGLLCLVPIFTATAMAQTQNPFVDYSSGVDESFRAGYADRTFAKTFHDEQVYGIPTEEALAETWKLDKQYNVSLTYEGNVFSDMRAPKDDLIYTFMFPTTISKKSKSGNLRLFYEFAHIRYIENEKLSRVNHTFGIQMKTTIDRLTLYIDDRFTPAKSVATGERTELKTAESSRVTTLSNDAKVQASYAVSPKTNILWNYAHNIFYLPKKSNAEGTDSYSTQSHTYGPSISYQWTPKTQVHVSYEWSLVDYFVGEQDTDSTTTTATAGIVGKINGKTGYTFDVGWIEREYKHLDVDLIDGFSIKAAVSRKLCEKVTASLSWSRNTASESLDTSAGSSLAKETDFYGLNLSWVPTPRLSLSTSAGMGFTIRDGVVTKPDVDNPNLLFTRQNDDDFYQWDISLRWQPRPYVSFMIAYFFFNKNGSFKDNEYENERIVGSVEGKF